MKGFSGRCECVDISDCGVSDALQSVCSKEALMTCDQNVREGQQTSEHIILDDLVYRFSKNESAFSS